MSFKRSVERNHKVEFTHQDQQTKSQFQSNFNLTWIPFHYKSLIILAVIFAFAQGLCVPLLAQYSSFDIALVLTHGIISSLLIVLAFYIIEKEKPPLSALFIRFCFCALIFGGFAFAVALMIM